MLAPFPGSRRHLKRYASRAADRDKTVWTGNPVRPEIVAVREQAYAAPENDNDLNVVVLGGSQGAKVLGEIVPQALADLAPEIGPG